MLKKTITYTDYDGNKRTEDFYFNMTKSEVLEMELSTTGGIQKMMERLVQEQDQRRIVAIFKEIIGKAYGRKSLDGRRFEKSEEMTREFMQTEAYSELFTELATDADAAAAFFNGIVPQIPEEEREKAMTQLKLAREAESVN